jgi:hypothetical protein
MKILFAVLFLAISGKAATPTQPSEKLIGTIVAYQRDLVAHMCFDSICGGSFIVRLDRSKPALPEYARIDFAYADNTSPYEGLNANRRRQFIVTRSQEYDSVLKRSFDLAVEGSKQKTDSDIPMWILVRGAENEALPYGTLVPSYRMAKNLTKTIWRRM